MYFTRTDDTFRAWFQVVRSNGVLRVNALSSSFIATIVNSTDSTHVSASVTQSLQKPGLYRFDIPASFISASGPGEYGVSVEVNITTAPQVATAFSEILRVSYQDFDTIVSASVSASMQLASSSVNQIVSGVWNASTSSFQSAGTMGYYQVFPTVTVSASISASVDVSSIVSGVWNANTATFIGPGTMGLALGQISSSFDATYQTLDIISSSVQQISSSVAGLSSSLSGSNTLILELSSSIHTSVSQLSSSMVSWFGVVTSSLNTQSSSLTQISSSIGFTQGLLYNLSSSVNLTYDTLLVVSSSVMAISNSIVPLAAAMLDLSSSLSGLTSGSIADAVWDEVLSTHSLSGSTGKALQEVGTRVHEIYQILGLELGSPMTVTQTLRAVAAISQSLGGSPTTSVTVTRL